MSLLHWSVNLKGWRYSEESICDGMCICSVLDSVALLLDFSYNSLIPFEAE